MPNVSFELLEVEIDLFDIMPMEYSTEHEKTSLTKFYPSIRDGFTASQTLIDLTVGFEVYRDGFVCTSEIVCKFQIIAENYDLVGHLKDSDEAQDILARLCEMSFFIFIGVFKSRTIKTNFNDYPIPIKNTIEIKRDLASWFKQHG